MNSNPNTPVAGLVERLRRNRDALRYILNWSDRPRTHIGTLFRTFTRDAGDDYSVTTKERLEQLYEDTAAFASHIEQLEADKRALVEALEQARVLIPNCYVALHKKIDATISNPTPGEQTGTE